MNKYEVVPFCAYMGDPSLEDWPALGSKIRKVSIARKPNFKILETRYVEHTFTDEDEEAVLAETDKTIK